VITICLPDDGAVAALGDLSGRVHALSWNGRSPYPPGMDAVEFFVPAYRGGVVDVEVFEQMPRLRVIQLLTAGVESWLGRVPANVVLCSGRGIHGGSTAELAVAGILSHLRQLPVFAEQQRRHEWKQARTEGLREQRVLVLGAGDIGTRVANAVRVFDGEVTLVARTPRAGIHAISELPELLPAHDVVVLALPNTPETTGLADAGFLSAMPDGALLVNVSRGPLVDTQALLAELNSRRLFAFLDVFEVEPLPAEDPLWSAPNLVLTPHVGGGTLGWEQVGYRLVRNQVQRFLDGEPLANVVAAGY
jgi:phosphoglycerate dehydrogenase-like enzyme